MLQRNSLRVGQRNGVEGNGVFGKIAVALMAVIIDCVALWQWLMVAAAMAVVIVGGCGRH